MQALQVVKVAMWKGKLPSGTLYVPSINEEERPPCTFVVNEIEFEEWTMAHPRSCPGAVHFSGKAGMERTGRLETSMAMWQEWRKMCRTRTECAAPSSLKEKERVKGKRSVVLNLAAGACMVATIAAAMG